jgi:hypothetical protein
LARRHYPKPVEEIIDRALRRQAGWPKELVTYAGHAKSGHVLWTGRRACGRLGCEPVDPVRRTE